MKNGRRFGTPPKPYEPPATPQGEVNATDPDARVMEAFRGYVQGYNAQAAVNEQQIVLAAEITVDPGDFSHLEPMVTAAMGELEQAGVIDKPQVVVADAGYWNEQHMDRVTAEHGIPVLIPPDSSNATGSDPAGPAAATPGCDTCSPANSASSYTKNANRQSSPCSVTPSTTDGSVASIEEADQRYIPSGD
jgi:hypothetical protein